MTSKLNRWAYQQLIDEDIAWLLAQGDDTLERHHIEAVLRESVAMYYPEPEGNSWRKTAAAIISPDPEALPRRLAELEAEWPESAAVIVAHKGPTITEPGADPEST